MSVEEYRLKFEELSMYVGGLSDQQKQERFLNGLKAHYRRTMGFNDFPSYKACVEAALRLDSQFEQTARFIGPPSRKRTNDPTNTWDKGKKSRSSSDSSRGNTASSGGSSGPRTACFICGSRDHYCSNCPNLTEGKRHTKVADVGEVVGVEEVNRVDSEAVPPNRPIKIRLQAEINIKEVYNLNNINHLIIKVNYRTKDSKEVGFST